MKKVSNTRRIAPAAVIGLVTVAAGLIANPSPAAAASTTVYLWQDVSAGAQVLWVGAAANDKISSMQPLLSS